MPELNIEFIASLPRRREVDTKCVAFDMTLGALTDNGATPWMASVGLGTPPQQLNFAVDTGTTNSWITSVWCETDACHKHNCFQPSASTTYDDIDKIPHLVDFGPWGNMKVVIGSDRLTLKEILPDGGQPITIQENLKMELATDYTGPQFAGLSWDGGLAVPSVPVADDTNLPAELLPQLISQNLIDIAIVSFYQDPVSGRGECLFGAMDFDRFDPDTAQIIDCLKLEKPLDYLWAVPLNDFICGGESLLPATQFVLDSGASWFKGSEEVIGQFTDAITDNGRLPTTVNDPSKLAEYPDITFVLDGKPYTLTPQQYFLRIPPDSNTWILGFHVLKDMPPRMILVGSLFMDTIYSAYYYGSGTPGEQKLLIATPI